MIATAHLLVGAAIGRTVRRPWVSLPLAFASHFILDHTPHIDPHAILGAGDALPGLAETAWGAVDGIVGIVLVLLIARGQPARGRILAAAFVALLPDLICAPWVSWPTTAPVLGWICHLHRVCHTGTPLTEWPLATATQVVAIATGLWVCRKRPTPSPNTEAVAGWNANGVSG